MIVTYRDVVSFLWIFRWKQIADEYLFPCRFSLLNFYFNPSSRPTKRTILCWNQYNDSYLRLHSNLRVRLLEKAEEANLEVIQCSQSLAFLEFRNYSGEYQTWEDREFDESRFFEGTDWGSPLLLDLKKKLFMNLNKIIYVTRKKRCEVNVDSSAEKSLDSWTALQDSKPWMDFRSLPDEVKMSTVTVRFTEFLPSGPRTYYSYPRRLLDEEADELP
ncbi:hypothetical protein AKJ16_DCAP25141 [Drosera capensis]